MLLYGKLRERITGIVSIKRKEKCIDVVGSGIPSQLIEGTVASSALGTKKSSQSKSRCMHFWHHHAMCMFYNSVRYA